MSGNKTYKYVREQARIFYKKFGMIRCAALNNEPVSFQSVGFKHLIYKGKRFRPIPDQLRRFKALNHIKEILAEVKEISEYRVEEQKIPNAQFWSLKKKIDNKTVVVILRKIGNGPLHFFSTRSQ